MRRTSVTIAALISACFFFQSCGRLAITNISLFDPEAGTMLPNRTIIVDHDRIVAIGTPANPVKVPAFSKVINGSGKYIIPGLIDAHTHLVFLLDSANVE